MFSSSLWKDVYLNILQDFLWKWKICPYWATFVQAVCFSWDMCSRSSQSLLLSIISFLAWQFIFYIWFVPIDKYCSLMLVPLWEMFFHVSPLWGLSLMISYIHCHHGTDHIDQSSLWLAAFWLLSEHRHWWMNKYSRESYMRYEGRVILFLSQVSVVLSGWKVGQKSRVAWANAHRISA
jgi:hypothetical protein